MATTKSKAGKKPAKHPADQNGASVQTDVLTLAEAAAYLRVTEADVVNSVNAQGLPGRQVGGEWRFLKASLQDWLNTPASKSGNQAVLDQWGTWKDDPYIDEMLKEIYKQRGRPMTEDEE